MERHAMTLHLSLAKRGHELPIFTTSDPATCPPPSRPTLSPTSSSISLSLLQRVTSPRTPRGSHCMSSTWKASLFYAPELGISPPWRPLGMALRELLRPPDEHPSPALTARAAKVVDEVRFFHRYAHHIATSDHLGDVLRRVYMLPAARVHVILNGVDEDVFRPDRRQGEAFRRKLGLPDLAMVVGMAGQLVKDKGPIMFEALKQIFIEDATAKHRLFVLVAGDGLWGSRYKALGPNLLALGALEQTQLASFSNALDIFANTTLRAQGLDHTLLEAIFCRKPLMATGFKSITGSVVVGHELGYTFSPSVESLKEAVYGVVGDGRGVMEKMEAAAR